MKIEINTTDKTIKILEDIQAKELLALIDIIKDIDEYKIIQTTSYYQPYIQPYIMPYTYPIIYNTCTITTNDSSGMNSFYSHNFD
jgi:hypothetical protein